MKAFVFLDVAKENLPLSFTRHALLQPNGIIKIFPQYFNPCLSVNRFNINDYFMFSIYTFSGGSLKCSGH